MTHDYTRHGTTRLFAALEVASGKVHGRGYPRHRHLEFIAFLESLARLYPKLELHLICYNYGTHKHPAAKRWLAARAGPMFPSEATAINGVRRSGSRRSAVRGQGAPQPPGRSRPWRGKRSTELELATIA